MTALLRAVGALVFLVIMLALSTALFRSFGPVADMPLFAVVGSLASLLSYLFLVLPLYNHLKDSWRTSNQLRHLERLKRRLVITLYAIVFGFCVIVFTVFMLDILSLLLSRPVLRPSPVSERLYRFALPILTTVLATSLLYKLYASTMLDRQKQCIEHFVRDLNEPSVADAATVSLRTSPGLRSTPASRRDVQRLLLEDLCKRAIETATKTGLRSSPTNAHVIAGIFLADINKGHFVPVATYGGSAAYQRAMMDFRPPFLDFPRFRALYSEFAARAADENPRNFGPMLTEFRTASAGLVSNCGMVYALERKFIFGPSLYSRCIAHRFDFLDNLPPQERDRYKFEQSVGLPLVVLGRKVGVMLLLSDSVDTFYHRDEVLYDVIGNTVALGVRGLFHDSDIDYWIPEAKWDNYPKIGAAETDRREVRRFVNSITDNFKWRKATWTWRKPKIWSTTQ